MPSVISKTMKISETPPVKAYVGETRAAKYDFELYPQLWERKNNHLRMRKARWSRVYFCDKNKHSVPDVPGIYMFVVAPRHAYIKDHTYVFYVGKTTNLKRRYCQYIREEYGEDLEHDRERIVDFLSRFRGYVYFHYHVCDEREIEQKEDYLVDRIFPWANSRHKSNVKALILKEIPL